MSYNAPQKTGTSSARTMSIIGIVLAVVALLFIPLVGVVGAVLGFVANAKGDKPMGLWVGIANIVCVVVGIIIGAIVLNAVNN